MSEKLNSTCYAMRWRPDFRYIDNKLEQVTLKNFDSTEPSVTDKEAYRVTLASLRGELARGSGKIDVGSYSIPAGKEYDPRTDFSFLNRKDLTIVELDDYIRIKKEQLLHYDDELSTDIKKQLAKAEKIKQTLEKEDVDKNESVE